MQCSSARGSNVDRIGTAVTDWDQNYYTTALILMHDVIVFPISNLDDVHVM